MAEDQLLGVAGRKSHGLENLRLWFNDLRQVIVYLLLLLISKKISMLTVS